LTLNEANYNTLGADLQFSQILLKVRFFQNVCFGKDIFVGFLEMEKVILKNLSHFENVTFGE
jgi:hypothetical protein